MHAFQRATLDFCFTTAQRIFAIKTRRTKPHAAFSQNYLLVVRTMCAKTLIVTEATATRKSCVLSRAKLDFCSPISYRLLIRSVLIHGICLFKDATRAATAASIGAPSLTVSTRMRGFLLRSRHAGEVA